MGSGTSWAVCVYGLLVHCCDKTAWPMQFLQGVVYLGLMVPEGEEPTIAENHGNK